MRPIHAEVVAQAGSALLRDFAASRANPTAWFRSESAEGLSVLFLRFLRPGVFHRHRSIEYRAPRRRIFRIQTEVPDALELIALVHSGLSQRWFSKGK